MKRIGNIALSCFQVVLCLVFLANITAMAQDANSLSRDIKKELRSAKSMMYKGMAEEALGRLDGIQEKIDELKSVNPKYAGIKGIERDYNRLKKDLSRHMKKETGASKGGMPGTIRTAPGKSDKLKSAAGRYIRKMDQAMKGVDRRLEKKHIAPESILKAARYELEKVERYWKDLQKKYPDTLDHPDVVAAKKRMDSYYTKVDAFEKGLSDLKAKEGKSQAIKASGSGQWITKLEPYVRLRGQQGYVPEKEFVASYTEDPKDMDQRMKLYVEASNLFDEYQKAKFPEGKTDELLAMEKALAHKLKTYREELKMAADRYFDKAANEIKRGESNLARNEERTKDGKTKPILLHALVLNNIARDMAWAENLMPGDRRSSQLKAAFETLLEEQHRWREKMIESTVMLGHKFKGKESNTLKKISENIVKKKFSNAKILRVNVISPDWKEERALEYTDTTRTAIRYRVTRCVTGQVVAKRGDDCFLYTTYVAKNRRSDGSWGEYFGHIMFTDRILEKNVSK